jgi:hypothetical protein
LFFSERFLRFPTQKCPTEETTDETTVGMTAGTCSEAHPETLEGPLRIIVGHLDETCIGAVTGRRTRELYSSEE